MQELKFEKKNQNGCICSKFDPSATWIAWVTSHRIVYAVAHLSYTLNSNITESGNRITMHFL